MLKQDKTMLLSITDVWILPGTMIVSDCWRAHNCLRDAGINHQKVQHSKNFVDPDTRACTNMRERVWWDVHLGVLRYCCQEVHFGGYKAEFLFNHGYQELESHLHACWIVVLEIYKPRPPGVEQLPPLPPSGYDSSDQRTEVVSFSLLKRGLHVGFAEVNYLMFYMMIFFYIVFLPAVWTLQV